MTRAKKILVTAAMVAAAAAVGTSPALADAHATVAPQDAHATSTDDLHATSTTNDLHATSTDDAHAS
ncbi:hypothetical protein GCM10010329_48990 [Streptomyces spiroverticillatus]|uniref:Secreted protein n=1 Tax=Streptomyces finlayi TaxID=67296 RepID=A0A918X178_9ACTN|nr:hypothetical protein [Streptomyces finlayi]GHA20043.1 hypothetical protein GCM10010329_48990 [Streptomyces spiroverticillatus]GHD02872.1 hypothetical protein GCM10010334_49940 [Streptomyces finlayi]